MSLRSFVWQFIKQQPLRFFFIFLLSSTWAIESTLWPYLLRLIVDTMTHYDGDRYGSWEILKWLLLASVGLWLFVELSFRTRDFLQAYTFPKMEASIRMTMFDHIQHHSPRYFNEKFAGSLANKITDMTTQITLMLQNINIFIPALASGVISLLFFSEVSWVFVCILGAWMTVHFAICFFYTTKCVNNSNLHGEARSVLTGKIVDSFSNNFAVNLFYRYAYEKMLISFSQKKEQQQNQQAQYTIAKMFSILSVVFLIGILALNAFLILFWIQSKITTGEVIQVFNTTFNISMIIWYAGDLLPQFYKSIGIATQALAVMEDPQDVIDPPGTPDLLVKQGEIIFQNVSFQYGEKKLFENKDVQIKGGEKVGLVGFSGAGKTTFVNLILRFFPLEQGKISIDGQDISHITLESLRRQVCLIPQDPQLFHRTLEENIHYGKLDATEEEVREAARMAHCEEFIENCPRGYASLVGERGTKLSGGERQRIAIARAVLTRAPILILDEATSSLDSVTEGYIQDSLERLMCGRTVIVIAHRLSTLAKMDRIFVFDQGKIVEEGTHEQLLARHGQYARMWQMQAGGFLPRLDEE